MRYVFAALAGLAVFPIVCGTIAVATPWLFQLFYKCAPNDASCGDTAGWGMVMLSPILVPIMLLLDWGQLGRDILPRGADQLFKKESPKPTQGD
jgi:hypothetical protein